MTMRQDWQAAKKQSSTNFKKAYDGWMKDQEKKAKLGDAKAKKAFTKEILKQIDATFGHEYTEPMSFNADLGPTLVKIEKPHATADAALDAITIDDMIKKKSINSLWKQWAEQVNYTAENYHFLTTGFKLSPDKMYDLFIDPGGKYALNIDSSLSDKWNKCKTDNDWKTAKTLVKPTVEVIYSLSSRDSVEKFKKHGIMAKYLRDSLGGKDVPKNIEKARKACMLYARQSQAYGKRWKKQKPDFWTPLNKALDDILKQLSDIAELYP